MTMNTLKKTLQNAPGRIAGYLHTLRQGKAAMQRIATALLRFLLGHRTLILVNHVRISDQSLFLANDFTVLQDDWVQILPYGDFPHTGPVGRDGKPYKENGRVKYPNGVIQRINNEATEKLISEFNSLIGKASRIFGGLPWYIGHHDLDPIKYPDPKAYGWIMKLENRADGLYAQVKWTDEGKELKDGGAFKYLSPFFNSLEDTGLLENGMAIVYPAWLKSVAFTNAPNMPVKPLANELGPIHNDGQAEQLLDHAGIANEAKRERWMAWFCDSFVEAAFALANVGTREGALKGWETRRRGMSKKDAAAKAAAKTRKTSTAKKGLPKKPSAKELAARREATSRGADVQMNRESGNLATADEPSPAVRAAAQTQKKYLAPGVTDDPGQYGSGRNAPAVQRMNAILDKHDAERATPPPLPQRAAIAAASTSRVSAGKRGFFGLGRLPGKNPIEHLLKLIGH